MFNGLNYITLYWLSGFAEAKYEIWDSKKVSIKRSEDSLSFNVYLPGPGGGGRRPNHHPPR